MEFVHTIVDIGIVCSDFEESLHFYRDLLGFREALDIRIPADVATGACLAPREFRQVAAAGRIADGMDRSAVSN